MRHILIAEDDGNIRSGLVDLFESEGWGVTAAPDGDAALAAREGARFDVVLLDVMMPGQSGYDVCRAIRSDDPDTPVIMLTAKGEEIDKVVGLRIGADDYVTKPFGVQELLARVEAVCRRSGRGKAAEEDASAEFDFGAARIDPKRYVSEVAGVGHSLTARELELIRFFRAHAGEALSRDLLLDAVWGVHYGGTTRTLDQHVSQLRKKVELDPAAPTTIQTVHGVGYRYEG